MNRAANPALPSSAEVTAWEQAAEAISLQRLDEADSLARPSAVSSFYSDEEYRELAEEQEQLWPAEGERTARPFKVRARGFDTPANTALAVLAERSKTATAAREDHRHAAQVLTPYVRREPGAKLRYWLAWPVLALGDASGILSAAISWGDVPVVAAGQALSAGLAGACGGLIGSELKHLQLQRARRRDPEDLSEAEQRYRRLFMGSDGGLGVVKLIAALSLLLAALLAMAVFALRSSVEGSTSGLTFGLIAFVTALASGLLGYQAADEVADLLAVYATRARHAEQQQCQLAGDRAIRTRAEADEAASSLQAEYALRGQAAGKHVDALRWRILRRNPHVAGHGLPAGESSGLIGRRPRRSGSA